MEKATKTRRLSRGALIALVAALAVVGITLGLLIANVANDNHRASAADPAAQAASVQQACSQWLEASPGQNGTPSWCGGMADWMTGYMADNGLGPQMMWSSPDKMRGTCRQWLTADPPPATGSTLDPQAWFDTMVNWMTDHMRDWASRDNWDDWMMNGPMMDR